MSHVTHTLRIHRRVASLIYYKQHQKVSTEQQAEDIRSIEHNIKMLSKVNQATDKSTNLIKDNQKEDKNFFNDVHKFFKYRIINQFTLCIIIAWTANSMVYFGINYNVGTIPGDDRFVNAALALIEIPSMLLMVKLIDMPIIGRKRHQFYSLILAGIFMYITTFLFENEYNLLGQIFTFVAKFMVTGAYQAITLWSSEIYSTDIRSMGYSCNLLFSRFAGMVLPFIIDLESYKSWLPGLIMGTCGILGGFATIGLPETLNEPLLINVEEVHAKHTKNK